MRVRLPLGLALTGLMLIAVLSTAVIVHASWNWAAGRNVETIVASLSGQSAETVRRELDGRFRAAKGVIEVVRSILFQGTVRPSDEAKREFIFLSVLRSLPAVSWVGFGFPDGRFFGAHSAGEDRIEMVEIGAPIAAGKRALRRDRYRPLPGDVFFEERQKGESAYVSLGQAWYRSALKADGPQWSMVDILPSGFEPAAVVSQKLTLYGRFEGVLMVSIDLARLSEFLGSLDIARDGVAVILDRRGSVIASSLGSVRQASLEALAQDAGAKERLVRAVIARAPGAGEAPPGTGGSTYVDSGLASSGRNSVYVRETGLGFNGWKLATAIPREAFTGEIDRNLRRLFIAIAGLAALAAITAAIFANFTFGRPIARMAQELRHVENFSLGEVKHIKSPLRELDDLSGALKRMAASLASFSLYIPTEIVRTLVRQGVEPKPGGEAREITVLFADLPGFTKLTEQYGAGVAPFLTSFLTLATEIVHREGGTVDKFIGDCIMAFWNAPTAEPDHVLKACRAANVLRDAMQTLARPDGVSEGPRIRIGINTGTALVGHVGSSQRLSYTAIGDAVNVASRLEAQAKEFGVEILIGQATKQGLAGRMSVRPLGRSAIRGRAGGLEVYELLAAALIPVPAKSEAAEGILQATK